MKIKQVFDDYIVFDNGTILESEHDQDCCESHHVDFTSIIGQGWEDKDFPEHLSNLVVNSDLPNFYDDDYSDLWRSFFQIKDIEGNKYTLSIYNSNNGYYSQNVTLVLTIGSIKETLTVQ